MYKRILAEANRLQPEMVDIRRRLHRYPETGFEEWETARLIQEKLTDLGLVVTAGVAGTGVVAFLPGKQGGRTVALRADMDALPVEEENDTPYRSRRPGFMHACGHDAHVAMLIGAARILGSADEKPDINVKFIFQPCEEQPRGGAEPMIKEGVLENPRVDAIFALHANPYIPAGFLGLKEGTVMAAADQFTVAIRGRGGHGAAPHQTVDPVVVSSHVIQALQAIVSRQVDPLEPVVVSVCAVHGGSSFNVIADNVTLTGTVRTLNPAVQQLMPERIRTIVKGVTSGFGADFEFDYRWGYPALVNNRQVLDIARQAGWEVLGRQRVLPVEQPSMGSEDFACFTGHVPGAYVFLGMKPHGREPAPWHSPRFDIDESALAAGAAFLAGCVIKAGHVLKQGDET